MVPKPSFFMPGIISVSLCLATGFREHEDFMVGQAQLSYFWADWLVFTWTEVMTLQSFELCLWWYRSHSSKRFLLLWSLVILSLKLQKLALLMWSFSAGATSSMAGVFLQGLLVLLDVLPWCREVRGADTPVYKMWEGGWCAFQFPYSSGCTNEK